MRHCYCRNCLDTETVGLPKCDPPRAESTIVVEKADFNMLITYAGKYYELLRRNPEGFVDYFRSRNMVDGEIKILGELIDRLIK